MASSCPCSVLSHADRCEQISSLRSVRYADTEVNAHHSGVNSSRTVRPYSCSLVRETRQRELDSQGRLMCVIIVCTVVYDGIGIYAR